MNQQLSPVNLSTPKKIHGWPGDPPAPLNHRETCEEITSLEVQRDQGLSIAGGLGPQGFEVVDLTVVDQNHLGTNSYTGKHEGKYEIQYMYI